jgi:NAD-reducing hydrogenase small subunit
VEGAVSSEDDLRKILEVRRKTKILVSLGDCAVTANVPGMRNPYGPKPILDRAYLENVTLHPGIPTAVVPRLLAEVRPVHAVVKVDVFIPGCPPSADTIYQAIDSLLSGQTPDLAGVTIFG